MIFLEIFSFAKKLNILYHVKPKCFRGKGKRQGNAIEHACDDEKKFILWKVIFQRIAHYNTLQ